MEREALGRLGEETEEMGILGKAGKGRDGK